MAAPFDNSSTDTAAPSGAAGVQPPQAADAAVSPRQVIRGESSPLGKDSHRSNGKAIGAITDYLNVSFPLPKSANPAPEFFDRLTPAIGSSFGIMEDLGRGLHGYKHSFRFERGGVRFACGGQAGTGFLSIPGEGCALVADWGRLVALLRDDLGARITRWDGAVDDFEGAHSVDGAVALYRSGAFNGGGRKPSCDVRGNWIEADDSGRTFYVGKRRNGKLLRVYEKGKQLGAVDSPWVRWEVELHNIDRVIPWEVIDDPARFIAGAYPALSWINGTASRIPTLQRTDGISYRRIIFYARMGYGKLIETMLRRDESAEDVVRQLRRPGVPVRLALTEALGTREGPVS